MITVKSSKTIIFILNIKLPLGTTLLRWKIESQLMNVVLILEGCYGILDPVYNDLIFHTNHRIKFLINEVFIVLLTTQLNY